MRPPKSQRRELRARLRDAAAGAGGLLAAGLLAAGSMAGCQAGHEDPRDATGRPPIDTLDQRVCLGRALPMNHIDEVVPGPDGQLAIVGRGTRQAADGSGVEVDRWVVAILDPDDPLTPTRVIERRDARDRPTPIAWTDEGLLVTHGGERLAPIGMPEGPGFEAPIGVPSALDPDTPALRVTGDRIFMVLGAQSPRGDTVRNFVEVLRGDPEAGTADRVVATYGVLRGQDFAFGYPEEQVGRYVEAAGVTDWHIQPDGILVAMGWVQTFVGPRDFFYVGERTPVDSDPEAGWFDGEALAGGTIAAEIDLLPNRVSYDLRGDAAGAAQLIFYDPASGPSTTPFAYSAAFPIGRTVYDLPPPFADTVRITTVDRAGEDLLLAGSACLEPRIDDGDAVAAEPRRCRAFVSRQVGGSPEVRWTVTVDAGDIDHVIDVRPIDQTLLVLAAKFDPPDGRGSGTTPARVALIDRGGRCLGE